MLLFSLLIFVTRLLSVSTLDVLQLRHSNPNPNSNPNPAPTGTHLWSAFDCRQSSRGKVRGHPLMTQCQANSRLPTLLSALVAECLFSDWPRQRDTSGQDPFAAVLRCSLFELFAQPLQKRRQNELRGSQVEAQTDSRDSENRQTDGQRDSETACSSSSIIEWRTQVQQDDQVNFEPRHRPRVFWVINGNGCSRHHTTTTTRSPL